MVSIIAFVVLRYSYNYLDGDKNQVKFIQLISITIAFVQFFILSNNLLITFLAWVATSFSLQKLLIFYPDRKKAQIAAKKKFIVARLGDAFLFVALALVYYTFQTGDLSTIFVKIETLTTPASAALEWAAVLLVLAAAMKSAQLPTHGWLVEVMEAPTPVSALLHAGLLNAGPFLIIRFSHLFDFTHYGSILLLIIGAGTALFGALVFTRQPNIKGHLAYSSVAHMGFSLMVSGMGVYTAGLLHLMAHSFYKAHAFLSSGSIVDKVRTKNALQFQRQGSFLKIAGGVLLSVALFLGMAYFWKINAQTPIQILIISGIIFSAIMSLIIPAIDSNNNGWSILKTLGFAALVIQAFFFLEEGFRHLIASEIPPITAPNAATLYISTSILAIYFSTIVIHNILSLKFIQSSAFGVHIKNGFYLNIWFDKLTNAIQIKSAKQ